MEQKSPEQIIKEYRQIQVDRVENSHKIDMLFK